MNKVSMKSFLKSVFQGNTDRWNLWSELIKGLKSKLQKTPTSCSQAVVGGNLWIFKITIWLQFTLHEVVHLGNKDWVWARAWNTNHLYLKCYGKFQCVLGFESWSFICLQPYSFIKPQRWLKGQWWRCSPKTQWRAYSRGRRWWSGSRRTHAWI